MKATFTQARNRVAATVYRHALKPRFFRQDPEQVHDRIANLSERLGRHSVTRAIVRNAFDYRHPMLEQEVLGLKFRNPVGLSAGFDKNARQTQFMPQVGFGFMEVGSITGEPCAGNPKPRLWRLPKEKSLVIWYGLLNDGCEAVSERLRGRRFEIPVGLSIAKTNSPDTVETEPGIADYVKAYRAFEGIGDYCTVNISCPNTFGGQPFTDPHKLDRLLSALDELPHDKPVLVKFSPDVDAVQMDEALVVLDRHKVDGIICSNATKRRDKAVQAGLPDKGGLTGKSVQPLADQQLHHVAERTRGRYVLVGVGGVFTAEDAYRKIRSGASLVQMITGMIFEGPQAISDINLGLVRLLKRDGFKNISEAIGADLK